MSAPPVFLDTSALQHRYLDGEYSFRVRQIVAKARGRCYVADATVLEIASALAHQCRKRLMSLNQHDSLDLRFFQDVANRALLLRVASRQDVLRARKLIRFAKMINNRNLSSSDALIAHMCLELALETRSVVTFYTSDWGLYSTIREINAFRATVHLVLLGTPKGGVPAVTRALPARARP